MASSDRLALSCLLLALELSRRVTWWKKVPFHAIFMGFWWRSMGLTGARMSWDERTFMKWLFWWSNKLQPTLKMHRLVNSYWTLMANWTSSAFFQEFRRWKEDWMGVHSYDGKELRLIAAGWLWRWGLNGIYPLNIWLQPELMGTASINEFYQNKLATWWE